MEAAPDVRFHYVFTLFGRTVSTSDEEIKFEKLSLTTADETEIREALSIMAPGSSLILDRCGLSSEFLDSIRQDYDDVDLVWRVYYGTDGRYTALTNATTIRSVYNVTDSTCSELRYVRSVKYIDMGHNDTLTDLSFLSYMPDLEILIASGSAVVQLPEGIGNCKKLEFLELSNCGYITDLSPLEDCESLEMLNISHTKATEGLSALEERNMTHLTAVGGIWNKISQEDRDAFQEDHPDCWIVTSGTSSTRTSFSS